MNTESDSLAARIDRVIYENRHAWEISVVPPAPEPTDWFGHCMCLDCVIARGDELEFLATQREDYCL
jgi:hypothetical protein